MVWEEGKKAVGSERRGATVCGSHCLDLPLFKGVQENDRALSTNAVSK